MAIQHAGHGLHHMHRSHPSQISWTAILLQFLLGGTLVASVSYIVSHVSSKMAALIYALPITYIPILVFVWLHAENQGQPRMLQQYTGQTLAGMVLLLFFCAALYWMTAATLERAPTGVSTAQFVRNVLIALLFMAVPMVWYYYWVCPQGGAPLLPRCKRDGAGEAGEACSETPTCYFG